MIRSRIRRLRRSFSGGHREFVIFGGLIGAVYTIVTFFGAFQGPLPMYSIGLGGFIAGLTATIPATYQWGDGMFIGSKAAVFSAVIFIIFQTLYFFYEAYVLTESYYLLVVPTLSLTVGLLLLMIFMMSGGIAGLIVFKTKGWRIKTGSTNGEHADSR